MSQTTLLAMFSFSFVMSIAPGPVILLIITSGVNHGFYKTFSFISGATIGFILLLVLMALGLSQIYNQFTNYFLILEIFGILFICYMGFKIATAKSQIKIDEENIKYLKFHEGFLFQWLNPKAWIAALSGISMFYHNTSSLVIFVVIYFFVCYFCLSFWGILGQKATNFLSKEKDLQKFNKLMGSILIITAGSIAYTYSQKIMALL